MPTGKKNMPDLFAEEELDPVRVASGATAGPQRPGREVSGRGGKKKAGFYLPREILDRFTFKFYELKLAGAPVENKSALLEMCLAFALDELDRGAKSRLLQLMQARGGK